MRNIVMVLIGLSTLGFVLAVVTSFLEGGLIGGISPEGFSRASNNLALIAIALAVWSKVGTKGSAA